jgi:hypothetical protein
LPPGAVAIRIEKKTLHLVSSLVGGVNDKGIERLYPQTRRLGGITTAKECAVLELLAKEDCAMAEER